MRHVECFNHGKVSEQLDLFFDPIFQDEQSNFIQQNQNSITNIFSHLQVSQSFQNVFSILWNAKTPCFDMEGTSAKSKTILKNCQWKGVSLPCSSIFSQFPTDKGICCSFNMEAAEEIFNGETYVQLVNSLQSADANLKLEGRTLEDNDHKIQGANPGKGNGLVVDIGNYNCTNNIFTILILLMMVQLKQ